MYQADQIVATVTGFGKQGDPFVRIPMLAGNLIFKPAIPHKDYDRSTFPQVGDTVLVRERLRPDGNTIQDYVLQQNLTQTYGNTPEEDVSRPVRNGNVKEKVVKRPDVDGNVKERANVVNITEADENPGNHITRDYLFEAKYQEALDAVRVAVTEVSYHLGREYMNSFDAHLDGLEQDLRDGNYASASRHALATVHTMCIAEEVDPTIELPLDEMMHIFDAVEAQQHIGSMEDILEFRTTFAQ